MKPARIVLIEDNPADVLLIKLGLKENDIPHTLIEFESGGDAVRDLCASDSRHEKPDVIMLDLNTPRSDGFDTLHQLRQRFADVPIAILTSSRARADKERAARAGALYLEKASQLPQFLESVAATVKLMLTQNPVSHDCPPA